MEEGNENSCRLCSKSDVLHTYNFVLKQIESTFQLVSRREFSERILEDLQICITCAYKLQLAEDFKKDYDQICYRNNTLTPMKCFFCQSEKDLINISDNPNNMKNKITFLNFGAIRHNFNDMKACLRCLYSVDIWNEMKRNVYKLMDITEESSTTLDAVNNNTPLKCSRNSINLNSRTQNGENFSHTSEVINLSNKRLSWEEYLYQKLKNFRTVNKIIEEGISNIYATEESYTEDVDDKLFNKMPFVEIFTDSQISRDRVIEASQGSQSKNGEIIVISNSDSHHNIIKNKKTKRKKSVLSLKKSSNAHKQKKKSPLRAKQKKKLLKFKMPAKFYKDKRSKPTNVKLNSLKEPSDFVCNICGKKCTTKSDYLAHSLKHEKIEKLVINVLRMHLPTKFNVEELSPNKERRREFSSMENIAEEELHD